MSVHHHNAKAGTAITKVQNIGIDPRRELAGVVWAEEVAFMMKNCMELPEQESGWNGGYCDVEGLVDWRTGECSAE